MHPTWMEEIIRAVYLHSIQRSKQQPNEFFVATNLLWSWLVLVFLQPLKVWVDIDTMWQKIICVYNVMEKVKNLDPKFKSKQSASTDTEGIDTNPRVFSLSPWLWPAYCNSDNDEWKAKLAIANLQCMDCRVHKQPKTATATPRKCGPTDDTQVSSRPSQNQPITIRTRYNNLICYIIMCYIFCS